MALVLARLPRLPFSLDPLIAEAKRRARRRRWLLAAMVAVVVTAALAGAYALRSLQTPVPSKPAGAATGTSRSPIRVTLTAQNHHPHASQRYGWHWWYCVKVRTAAGKSVASTIHLQILSGRTPVEGVGLISLKKGYDHWCSDIGGEGNVLAGAPHGKKLLLQAVVKAKGATVKQDWPIVVR